MAALRQNAATKSPDDPGEQHMLMTVFAFRAYKCNDLLG